MGRLTDHPRGGCSNNNSQTQRAAGMPAALQTRWPLYQALRLPVKGNEPKAPALTLPDSLSPSTVPVKSRVSGIGLVILADQASVLPSTLPFSSGPEPCAACWVPVRTFPSVLISRLAFCAPRGELMMISHLPSTAMSLLQDEIGAHLRTAWTPAQGVPVSGFAACLTDL